MMLFIWVSSFLFPVMVSGSLSCFICTDIDDFSISEDIFLSRWQGMMIDTMTIPLPGERADEVSPDRSQLDVFQRLFYGKRPVVIRDMNNWHYSIKEDFLNDFGDIYVKTGSETSITYSNGKADVTMPIRKLMDTIDQSAHCIGCLTNGTIESVSVSEPTGAINSVRSDLFAFDINFTKNFTIYGRDGFSSPVYDTPEILRSWYNVSAVDGTLVYPVLSVGGVGVGLPFHAHGEAWLRLLSGMKLWLFVPPGSSPLGEEGQLAWDPFVPTRTWLENVLCPQYCQCKPAGSYSRGDMYASSCDHAGDGGRCDSKECVREKPHQRQGTAPYLALQRAGDIMYVPAGWKHLTMNVRKTHSASDSGSSSESDSVVVALGGQAVWTVEQRHSVCSDSADSGSDSDVGSNVLSLDYDCLKALGVGYLDRLKRSRATRPGAAVGGSSAVVKLQLDSVELNRGEAILRRAIAVRPHFPDARILLIEWLGLTGGELRDEVAATEAIYDSARERLLIDGDVTGRKGLATAYQRLAVAATTSVLTDKIRLVNKSLQLNPDHPTVLGMLMSLYVRAGDASKAMEALADMERVTVESVNSSRGIHITKMREYIESMKT